MMLTPLVLALGLISTSDPIPERIADIVRGLLPLTGFTPDATLRQLDAGEGRLEFHRAVTKDPLCALYLKGCAILFTKSGSFWCFDGYANDGRSQTALAAAQPFYDQGTAVANVLKIKYDRLEMELHRGLKIEGEYDASTLTLQPFLDGHCCTGAVTVTLHSGTAKLISVSKYCEDLDWDRLRGGPRISRQQAEASAVQAYLRFDPFPTAHISESELQFGCPAREDVLGPDDKAFIGEEFQGDEKELIERRIAWPFWVVVFMAGPTASTGAPLCCVYVDARNGHAAIVAKTFFRSAVMTESGFQLGSSVTVEDPLTHVKERMTAQASSEAGKVKDVLLNVASTLVRCKFDAENRILQIPSAGKEGTYRVPRRLWEALKKQADTKPFGGK